MGCCTVKRHSKVKPSVLKVPRWQLLTMLSGACLPFQIVSAWTVCSTVIGPIVLFDDPKMAGHDSSPETMTTHPDCIEISGWGTSSCYLTKTKHHVVSAPYIKQQCSSGYSVKWLCILQACVKWLCNMISQCYPWLTERIKVYLWPKNICICLRDTFQ